jgi:hypothetical protein
MAGEQIHAYPGRKRTIHLTSIISSSFGTATDVNKHATRRFEVVSKVVQTIGRHKKRRLDDGSTRVKQTEHGWTDKRLLAPVKRALLADISGMHQAGLIAQNVVE